MPVARRRHTGPPLWQKYAEVTGHDYCAPPLLVDTPSYSVGAPPAKNPYDMRVLVLIQKVSSNN